MAFLQTLEGDPAVVRALFSRIEADRRRARVLTLSCATSRSGTFPTGAPVLISPGIVIAMAFASRKLATHERTALRTIELQAWHLRQLVRQA